MAVNPCTLAVLSSSDVALFERVLAKADRWYSTGTQGSSPPISQATINPQTNGNGVPLCGYNLDRISTAIIVPSSASNLYMAFSQSFGVVTANVPQYGAPLAAGVIFTFGPEYCGSLYLLNCSSSAIVVGLIQILRDDSVW